MSLILTLLLESVRHSDVAGVSVVEFEHGHCFLIGQRGVTRVQEMLKENGNPPAEFDVNTISAFRVNVHATNNTDNAGDITEDRRIRNGSAVFLISVGQRSHNILTLRHVHY